MNQTRAGDSRGIRLLSQPLIAFCAVIIIVNSVIGLDTWSMFLGRLPEGSLRSSLMEDHGDTAIWLFVMSALLLFAKDLPSKATGPSAWKLGGCSFMLLLLVPASMLASALRSLQGYPDMLANNATVLVVTVALLLMIWEGIRSFRTRAGNRPPGENNAR